MREGYLSRNFLLSKLEINLQKMFYRSRISVKTVGVQGILADLSHTSVTFLDSSFLLYTWQCFS